MSRRILIGILLAGTVSVSLFAGGVAEQINRGLTAYRHHNYPAAASAFESALKGEPTSPESAFDLGTAEYRQGKYAKALKSFQKAEAADTASEELQARASYNQGKSLAKLGDAQVAKNPGSALSDYKKGVEAFARTLQVDPSMKKAGYNIEVLRRRIKKLEQRLKKQASSKRKQRSGSNPKNQKGPKTPNKQPHQAGPRSGKNRQPAGANPGNRGSQPSSGSQAKSGPGQTSAQRILSAEKNHRRIINLESEQVHPHVAQNW